MKIMYCVKQDDKSEFSISIIFKYMYIIDKEILNVNMIRHSISGTKKTHETCLHDNVYENRER